MAILYASLICDCVRVPVAGCSRADRWSKFAPESAGILHSPEPMHSRTETLEPLRPARIAQSLVDQWETLLSPSVMKIAPAVAIMVGALGLGGCATKGYVRDQIAPVSQRVDALESKLAETDSTAKSALSQAQAASGQAQNNGQRIDQLTSRVDGIEQRMQASQRKKPRN